MYLHPQKRSMFFYVIANRVLVTAATRHVSACHCEERGGRPATRQSVLLAAVQNKKQHLRRIRSGDEFALSAADFFPPLQERGLPRQCAHWLAMTGKRQMRTCVCKYVPTGKICNRLHVLFLPQFCGKRGLSPSWFVQIILRQPHKILLRMVQNRLGQRPVAPILVQILSRP